MMYITRRERFCSAHRLINNNLSEDDNQKLFGKCYNLHGHNYQLFVTVTGSISTISGFVIDIKDLKQIINNKIIKKLDHQNINEVDFMQDKITTTENLCVAIWQELVEPIRQLGGELYKIEIRETENNYFEYFGETLN
ncbi:MAG: 6-pyruvoyl tetrahydrobiopterin synthase [Flavobacteriales bacterium]|nr:6-pyruvoyl tetrahydrobiopterin synthase [Flavobacteriales bacterium]